MLSEKELQEKAKSIKEYMRMKEDIEILIKGLQDEIKSHMDEEKVNKITSGQYKIRYIDVETSRFDSKAFKESYNDLFLQFCRTSIIKKFLIT